MAKGNRETKKPKKEPIKKIAAAASAKGGMGTAMPTLGANKKK